MKNYGFAKVAAATPKLKVANPKYNAGEILKLLVEANDKGASVAVFPELCVTGYTCGDLFFQRFLIDRALDGLKYLIENSKGLHVLGVVGVPLEDRGRLLNCAVVFQNGQVKGVVPKRFIPENQARWFCPFNENVKTIELFGQTVPFGDLLFESSDFGFTLGIEIGQSLQNLIPESVRLAAVGADIIANLLAECELAVSAQRRGRRLEELSARCRCGYVHAAAGVHESTTDMVFGGDSMICENGSILSRTERFCRENQIIFSDIDIDRLKHERKVTKFGGGAGAAEYQVIRIDYPEGFYDADVHFERSIDKYPFVPQDVDVLNQRCGEIFSIQVSGLAKRLEHIGTKYAVIGVSGGLDSTLALLVVKNAFGRLGLLSENIIGITMPGFGTTGRTYENALKLMRSLNITIKEIDIKKACLVHFEDIGHDPDVHDVTYENVQARERTQILMDYANKIGGIVVGTGDLSEFALGWCTFNGDHMSMYAVNSGVPKTLIRRLIEYAGSLEDGRTREVLEDILATPISPELLPPDRSGRINQRTEELVGPYALHDFFLYHTLQYGAVPEKLYFLACRTFNEKFEKQEIKDWLIVFYKRFFGQQFKRSSMPDGPRVGSLSLSPRGGFVMPSDADGHEWIKRAREL